MPDGAVLVADAGAHRIRRVAPDGTISTLAGTGQPGYSPDGTAAAGAAMYAPRRLAVEPSGAVLVVEGSRVRQIGPDGVLRTVAGGGQAEPADGALGRDAKLEPSAVVALPDGEAAVSDPRSHRVWRVKANGTLAVLAGNGNDTDDNTVPFGDGGSAREALVPYPGALLALRDGSVLLADGGELRRVTPDGVIDRVAGDHGLSAWGPFAYPIAGAPFASFSDLAETSDDGVLIADPRNNRIRLWARGDAVRRLLMAPLRLARLGEPGPRLTAGFLLSVGARIVVEARILGGRSLRLRRSGAAGDNRIDVAVPGGRPVCRLRISAETADGQVAALVDTPFWDRPSWGSGGGPPPIPLRMPPPAYVSYATERGSRWAEIHIAPDGNATVVSGATVVMAASPLAKPRVRFVRIPAGELRQLRRALQTLARHDVRDEPDTRSRDGAEHRLSLRHGGFSALTPGRYAEVVSGARCLSTRDFPFANRRQWALIRRLDRLLEAQR